MILSKLLADGGPAKEAPILPDHHQADGQDAEVSQKREP